MCSVCDRSASHGVSARNDGKHTIHKRLMSSTGLDMLTSSVLVLFSDIEVRQRVQRAAFACVVVVRADHPTIASAAWLAEYLVTAHPIDRLDGV